MNPNEWNSAKPKQKDALDRLPPHSEEAERGVLGCILLEPARSLDDAQSTGVDLAWFYDLRHQTLYHRLTRMAATEVPISILTVAIGLKDAGEVEAVGGLDYLSALPDAVPSAANLAYYLDILREKWTARMMVRVMTEGVSQIQGADGAAAAVAINAVFREVEALNDGATPRRAVSLKEVLPSLIEEFDDYHRGSAQIKGLTTGLAYLDKILGGIGGKQGNLIVLAARPGVGKSALGMQVAAHIALDQAWYTPGKDANGEVPLDKDTGKPASWEEHRGMPVGVFSLEMSAEELLRRLLFLRSGVDAQRFKTGFAEKDDIRRLSQAAVELAKAKIYIDDDDSLTIEELEARARMMMRQHGIKLFVVDYIQCLRVGAKRFRQDRVQEFAEISSGLRRLGKRLNVPFLVLAQMNRDFAKEKGIRKPRLEDLRDSGAIEQDSHVVMFLYEEELNAERTEGFEAEVKQVMGKAVTEKWFGMPRRMQLLVAKNRHGMSNKGASLLFDPGSSHFEDYIRWKKRHGLMEKAAGETQKML